MTFTPLAVWAIRFTGAFRTTLLPSSAATLIEICWVPPTMRNSTLPPTSAPNFSTPPAVRDAQSRWSNDTANGLRPKIEVRLPMTAAKASGSLTSWRAKMPAEMLSHSTACGACQGASTGIDCAMLSMVTIALAISACACALTGKLRPSKGLTIWSEPTKRLLPWLGPSPYCW